MDNFAQLHWKFVSFNILWNWLLVSICILYECCVSIVYENNLFVSWKTCWFQAISHNTLPLPLPIINCKFCWWHSTKIAFHDTLRFKCTHISSQFFIPFVEIYPNVYVEIKQQKKREKKNTIRQKSQACEHSMHWRRTNLFLSKISSFPLISIDILPQTNYYPNFE